MGVYEESGLRLDLPDGAHFRFADTGSYQSLSGQSLKEMDFAWLHEDKLVLLELKNFTVTRATLVPADFVPAKNQPHPRRFDELVSKITDTLMMLLAGWCGTDWGKNLVAELPQGIDKPLKLVLAVGLDMPAGLKMHLAALRTALNARLQGRLKLASVQSIALMDYDTLISRPTFSPYVTKLAPPAPPAKAGVK
jgi:hypothetical protein